MMSGRRAVVVLASCIGVVSCLNVAEPSHEDLTVQNMIAPRLEGDLDPRKELLRQYSAKIASQWVQEEPSKQAQTETIEQEKPKEQSEVTQKVKEVIMLLRRADLDEKEKAEQADKIIMSNMGAKGYPAELCDQIWATPDLHSDELANKYCPDFVFSKTEQALTTWKTAASMPASMQRSAFLSQFLWVMLIERSEKLADVLDINVCFNKGDKQGDVCGLHQVGALLMNIGFPQGSKLMPAEYWNCDRKSCLVKVMAWGDEANDCYAEFGPTGLATKIYVPLRRWHAENN